MCPASKRNKVKQSARALAPCGEQFLTKGYKACPMQGPHPIQKQWNKSVPKLQASWFQNEWIGGSAGIKREPLGRDGAVFKDTLESSNVKCWNHLHCL